MNATPHNQILPARTNAHILRWFRWYTARMVKKSFAGVRLSKSSDTAVDTLRRAASPMLIAMNHSSWWDPLVGLLVGAKLCPERPSIAPMDREMLKRFGILRRVGVFGLDPDEPASLDAMRAYTGTFIDQHPHGAIWLTPQGEFVDPRAKIRLRPGAAALAAATPNTRVISLAIEYTFWLDKKPEILLHLSEVAAPDTTSLPAWHRAITKAMRDDNTLLTKLSIARDPTAFTTLLGSGPSGTSPIYNLWLRFRGSKRDLESSRTLPAKADSEDRRPA